MPMPNRPTARTPVLVDCDTGVDDAMALLYLLSRPDIELVGITTVFGNNTAAQCAVNSIRVLELVGRGDVPVAVGAERPIAMDLEYLATHVHGSDGLGDAGLPLETAHQPVADTAGELIARLAEEHVGRLRILAIGPLTNLALALEHDMTLADRVADVVIMGGAADAPGNQTAAAEANILHDPEAARAVIGAPWATTLVPLDVTMLEQVTERHRDALAASDVPAAQFVAATADFYFEHYGVASYGERRSPCHDALAAGVLTGEVVPTIFPEIDVVVDCCDGPGRGGTICDTRARYRGFAGASGNCRVALETSGDFADRLVAALLTLPTEAAA